ncbi:CAP domain-containing protein [Terribacillus saccharophilus]|uniref:CAP domain-containing protein n=1 Tax=Terribacillus saccharophilus TaxID=361277 RepID=UPI003982BD75
MKSLRIVLLLLVVGAGVLFFWNRDDYLSPAQDAKEKDTEQAQKTEAAQKPNGDIERWINQEPGTLEQDQGEPARIDKSSYGYEWYVYDKGDAYAQYAVKDDHIVSAFAVGEAKLAKADIGESREEVEKDYPLENEVSFRYGSDRYTFKLKEKDQQIQPLAQIGDGLFAQFYFDTFEDELTAVRVLTDEQLIMERPYDVTYTGQLPEQPQLSDEEWEQVQDGMEQQIIDITNVMRSHFDVPPLAWNDQVAAVALGHSEDMEKQQYFSHVTPEGEELGDRLADGSVKFRSAGENIAAGYTDAPAAMVGWLNSEGHRKTMLDDTYKELGVGVYRYYYTQNFLLQ